MSTQAFEHLPPPQGETSRERRTSSLLPQALVDSALRATDRVARALAGAGVTANMVTIGCLALAAAAGVSLAAGSFGWAAVLATVSASGDAVDGAIARRTRGTSVGGALLDSSADRYGEFFLLGGLALHFRDQVAALALTLAAIAGSFMVSYGSAKAEALRVTVPPGVMRRADRAICLCAGIAATTALGWLAHHGALPAWATPAPVFAALGVLAVVANASAISRLRALARGR